MTSLTSVGILGISGVGAAIATQGFLSLSNGDTIPGSVLGLVGGLLAAGTLHHWFSRFEVAEPSEWMLVIESGEQKSAAVGLQHFRGFMQTVVKFPARMRNVQFEAEQVTKEIQGVKLKGFCTWSIFREEDGPYRAYRSFDGLNNEGAQQANNNIGKLVASILRNMVSSMSIDTVMTERDEMRNQARKQLLEITKGWGIWIETVEITDVRIMSSSLFNNMQEAFRSETRLKAEEIRMKTDITIKERQRMNQVKQQELDENAQTRKNEIKQQQDLSRRKTDFGISQEKQKLELERIKARTTFDIENEQQATELKMARLGEQTKYNIQSGEEQNETQMAKLKNEQQYNLESLANTKQYESEQQAHKNSMDTLKQEHQRAMRAAELQLQNTFTERNVQLRQLEILSQHAKRINYDMKVVNVANGGATDLVSMIPGLAATYRETMNS